MASAKKQVTDRRIEKTRNLLHDALGSLIREKPYDAISVQEILDRANVGRSTFYTHFRGKDELLVSGIHALLRSAYPVGASVGNQREAIIRFSLPVFEHIHGHLRSGAARMGPKGRAVVHQHLQKVLADLIAKDVKDHVRRNAGKNPPAIPVDLVVQCVASTFILVLHWWLDSRSRGSPQEINDVFRTLILPLLAAGLD